MKTFKHFSTLMLVVAMLICSVNTSAFAAENNTIPDSATVMEFEITPEMMSRSGITLANDSWDMLWEYTGKIRSYPGNTVRYQITVTDTNGNSVTNMISLQLYNSSNAKIYEKPLWADGKEVREEIPISYGSSYYFKYALAYGDMRPLRIHMVITVF